MTKHHYGMKLINATCNASKDGKGSFFKIFDKCRPSLCIRGIYYPSEIDTNGLKSINGGPMNVQIKVISENLLKASIGEPFQLMNGSTLISTGIINSIQDLNE